MRIIRNGETIKVSEIEQLDNLSSPGFQSAIRASLPNAFRSIDIDLSRLGFIDCAGVGALIALRNSTRQRNAVATVRLLNPSPRARRMFQLTRIDKLFPIKNRARPSDRLRALRKGS
jgi:anti-anti-sigma factor